MTSLELILIFGAIGIFSILGICLMDLRKLEIENKNLRKEIIEKEWNSIKLPR